MTTTTVLRRSKGATVPGQAKTPIIIVLAAPKGGVGKTTLAMALLVAAKRAGFRTLGINLDVQQSLTLWSGFRSEQIANAGEGADIPEVTVESRQIDDYRQIVKDISDRYDIVVFDTPPGHSHFRNSVAKLCEMANLVLIPTSASDLDLDEVIPFRRDLAGERSAFVLNLVNRRANSVQFAQQRLLKAGRLCPMMVPRFEVIASQYRLGLTSQDTKDRGAPEFEAVWDFVRMELGL